MADLPDRNGVARALHPWLGPVTVEEFTRLSGGASKETWSFDAIGADGTRTGLILRRDPPGQARRSQACSTGRQRPSASRMTRVCRCRRCCSASARLSFGAAGMIMRRVEGETIARRILRDDEYAQARGVLVGQLGQFAAGLHAQDVPTFFLRPDPLAGLREQLDAFGRPSEVFELALAALAAAPPPRASRCCCTATSGSAT